MNTFNKIYEAVKKIPCGRVSTYGLVSIMALGSIRYSRVVGYALHVNPEQENIPCHRVVNRNGELSAAFAFGGRNAQKKLLEEEGIIFDSEYVNLDKYLWNP